ncbi:MAG: hypothetical protein J7K40_09395 [candidate division Zixibacteria bacterium]|nr:hypothetical protein [candidate division Zixibacteria bacterium]
MSIITTSNHPKALWPGVAAWWGRTYDEHKTEYTDLFDIESSNQSYEEDVQLTGFGLAPVKAEGASVSYDTESQGFVSRYTHAAIALGFICTYEDIKDNLYPVVGRRRGQANAFSMRQSKEIIHANIYNRAFNASYTFGDGKEILATDHPSTAGTWSNELATPADFSEEALEDLLVMIMTAVNDRGHNINLMAQSLHIHPNGWFEANRVLKSVLQNDTANNALNVLKATNALPGGIKMNHYFTDTDAWFVRTNAPRGMIGYQRDSYPLKQDNDFDTGNAKAKSYDRFSAGCTDPRGLYGSAGA